MDEKVRNILVENSFTRIEDLTHNLEAVSKLSGLDETALETIKTKLSAYLPSGQTVTPVTAPETKVEESTTVTN